MAPKMSRYLFAAITLGLIAVAIPLRAANPPHAGADRRGPLVWTNDDLEKLRGLDLISVVGGADKEWPASASAPGPYATTQDLQWYAAQAAKLHDELEHRRAQLHEYQLVIDDTRSLKETTGGINLDEGDIGVTPQAGIEFLWQRVNQTETELDALEDLARRHGIPPGTLRGQ